MWARVVEVMLGCWLAASPFVFRHAIGEVALWANDFACAAAVVALSSLSFSPSMRRMHLGNGVVALWLLGFGYVLGPAPPYQNHMIVGFLLAMLAIVPSEASLPSPSWRARWSAARWLPQEEPERRPSMQVKEIMTPSPACCTPRASLRDVTRLMVEHDCGCIPVAEDGCVLGVVTDRDIACRVVAQGKNPQELTAADCMSTPPITIREETSVEECCEVLEKHMIRRVMVVDRIGRLCGVVAQADIARRASEGRTAEVVRELSQPTGAPSRVQ